MRSVYKEFLKEFSPHEEDPEPQPSQEKNLVIDRTARSNNRFRLYKSDEESVLSNSAESQHCATAELGDELRVRVLASQ